MAGDVVDVFVPVDGVAHPGASVVVAAQQAGDLGGSVRRMGPRDPIAVRPRSQTRSRLSDRVGELAPKSGRQR